MATLTATTLRDSDDEEDEDYVPPTTKEPDSSDDERNAKRARTSSLEPSETDKLAHKQKKDALWQSFQASVASQSTSNATSPPSIKTVKIQKQHRFAGEIVTEVVDVPEDSDDAKKWPRWSETTHTASATTAALLPNKKPGPRKGRLSLNDLPDASFKARVKPKPKKLTTLDMSAMQWRDHVSTADADLKHELDASRRAGGYLEKAEFLERVGERKEYALETSKSGKRRRG